MASSLRRVLLLSSLAVVAGNPTVLVTGATGRTGQLVYKLLKEKGVPVRGLVRNATKARELLKCDKCDQSEGIFIGDVTQKENLAAAMDGATALAVATSAAPQCKDFKDPSTCSYPKGDYPVDVDFTAARLRSRRSLRLQRDLQDRLFFAPAWAPPSQTVF